MAIWLSDAGSRRPKVNCLRLLALGRAGDSGGRTLVWRDFIGRWMG